MQLRFLQTYLSCCKFAKFSNILTRCGHCKSLVPEYEKAASVLSGVVKVVAVDATQSPKLQAKYGIQGFPSLKIFGQVHLISHDYCHHSHGIFV